MGVACLNRQFFASGGLRFFGGVLRKLPPIFRNLPEAPLMRRR
jgi:hypothetical protein